MNKKGFSLVELLIVITLVFLITAASIPAYKDLHIKYKTKTQANDLHSLIYIARTEAIKRSHVVTLCKSTDKQMCGGAWSGGWLMFADYDEDGTLDTDDETILSGVMESDLRVDWKAFGSDNYIRLTPRGMMLAQNGTFTICPENGNEMLARAVVVSKLARVRLPEMGIDADGELIKCK